MTKRGRRFPGIGIGLAAGWHLGNGLGFTWLALPVSVAVIVVLVALEGWWEDR